jgi:hypothetical protein
MKQIFHPSMNTIARFSIIAAGLAAVGLGVALYFFVRSPFMTDVNVAREQPVPFSHLHHVRQLGIECRYCHTSVEESSFAGIPPTETCMTCHSQVWTESVMLEPVRTSFSSGLPIQWNRVNNVSDFVYFNHSIHVNKGVGCETCHGDVDRMPLMWKAETLQMEWCLQCHRQPEQFIRPVTEVFAIDYKMPANHEQYVLGQELVAKYGIEVGRLDNCSICHR